MTVDQFEGFLLVCMLSFSATMLLLAVWRTARGWIRKARVLSTLAKLKPISDRDLAAASGMEIEDLWHYMEGLETRGLVESWVYDDSDGLMYELKGPVKA